MGKELIKFDGLNFTDLERELREFKDLLDSNTELDERKQILEFFGERKNLSAFIGHITAYINKLNVCTHEFEVFSDFACDLLVGDYDRKQYLFIEFEDAKENSIFVKKKNRFTPEWGTRFERGYSQIIDWFWKLDDVKRSLYTMTQVFGYGEIKYEGLLVIGRKQFLDNALQQRLDWRMDYVKVNSKGILCMTYDDLYETLRDKYNIFQHGI